MGMSGREADQGRDGRQDRRVASGCECRASPDPVVRLASTLGNRGFARVARPGAGILPDGRVHPEVEATLARTRGSGRPLEPAQRERFGRALGDDLGDVRLHTDPTADALAHSVEARAFATGADVYFAAGEYRPGSSAGDELLVHELTHVVQQRGTSTGGPLTVSQPGDPAEREADAVSHELAR
jgi:hypothetical protein